MNPLWSQATAIRERLDITHHDKWNVVGDDEMRCSADDMDTWLKWVGVSVDRTEDLSRLVSKKCLEENVRSSLTLVVKQGVQIPAGQEAEPTAEAMLRFIESYTPNAEDYRSLNRNDQSLPLLDWFEWFSIGHNSAFGKNLFLLTHSHCTTPQVIQQTVSSISLKLDKRSSKSRLILLDSPCINRDTNEKEIILNMPLTTRFSTVEYCDLTFDEFGKLSREKLYPRQ
jgi:hypothetical protein